ncbi:MAG: heat-inducible transcriptional repressor HrcA [Gammaproteobacteria bacterium]|nr:heat-inducible transcriptional repressor HrcA [Gammaproteobacteria bacterium]
MSITKPTTLDDRAQLLLKALIDLYIRDGQPVGSRTLAQDSGIGLSPATIRNVMADLEGLGLVSSPHTSAGRIPTAQGYRLFVDTMLKVQPLDSKEVNELKKQLNPNMNSHSLMKSASVMLSNITHLAGMVMTPRMDALSIKHLEFLSLSNRRVLAILVINDKEVHNQIINTGREYSPSELQQAANYINAHILGHDLSTMREMVKRELQQTQQEMNDLMKLVIEMSSKVVEQESAAEQDELLVDGQLNLMGFDDLSNVEKLKCLFEAFQKKRDILHLLDRCQYGDGVQIFIGQESGYGPLDDCSVITSPYRVGGEVVGVLGVIGPTRMAYNRVIPIVDITARLLSAALSPKD